MKTVRQLLESLDRAPLWVPPDATVFTALSQLAESNVGALLVLEGERLVGIFSERDYARKIVLQGRASKNTPVSEVMTSRVVYITPEHTVDEALALMSDKHFRHLPVLDTSEKVLGVVSMRDLVDAKLAEQAFIIEQLERYITA